MTNESAEIRRARALRTNVPTNVMNVALMVVDEETAHDGWVSIPAWLADLFKQKPITSSASHGAFCTCPRC